MPGGALAAQAVDTHNHLLAHGRAVEVFREMGLPGRIGIALNLSPVYAASERPKDVAAARLEDGILNRWFLDAVLRGSYPEDVLQRYRAAGLRTAWARTRQPQADRSRPRTTTSQTGAL